MKKVISIPYAEPDHFCEKSYFTGTRGACEHE